MDSKRKSSPGARILALAGLLPLIFALADLLEHGEAGFFRVRDGERLELVRRTETGKDFAHRLFARRTIRERLGRKRAVQGEFSAAHLAVAFAQFVFVKRHEMNLVFR
jgi:hypothetical protein